MKTRKKLYRNLLILIIGLYAIFTLANQQVTLNEYAQNCEQLASQIHKEEENKEELTKRKEEVNTLDFIEQTAREKLDMYYPNERVYVDQGM